MDKLQRVEADANSRRCPDGDDTAASYGGAVTSEVDATAASFGGGEMQSVASTSARKTRRFGAKRDFADAQLVVELGDELPRKWGDRH